jgi:hypothetical protein
MALVYGVTAIVAVPFVFLNWSVTETVSLNEHIDPIHL